MRRCPGRPQRFRDAEDFDVPSRGRIEICRAGVREGVAGDFVALPVKLDDLVDANSIPMTGPFVDESARNIKRRARFIRIQNRRSDGGRAPGVSSNVKLTIGPLLRSRNGATQRWLDRLTRAFNAVQSGRMITLSRQVQKLARGRTPWALSER